MKYRHSFHAGNFADVHKHVTLLALLAALQKKDKGFLYLETHAGRGAYDLSSPTAEAAAGIGRFRGRAPAQPRSCAPTPRRSRGCASRSSNATSTGLAAAGRAGAAPAGPRRARSSCRAPRRTRCEESVAATGAHGGCAPHARVERGDGFAAPARPGCRRRAARPHLHRPALRGDAGRISAAVTAALAEALRRFPTGVVACLVPDQGRAHHARLAAACARTLTAPLLASELWLYPRDSRVALNGSGLLIANPPHLLLERMQPWLPQLVGDARRRTPAAGSSARMLSNRPMSSGPDQYGVVRAPGQPQPLALHPRPVRARDRAADELPALRRGAGGVPRARAASSSPSGGRGLNVTLPHKIAAVEVGRTSSPRAPRTPPRSTRSRSRARASSGDNTDGAGLVRDLCDNLGLVITNRRVLVIGAGGATRGVLAPLLGPGAHRRW